MAPLEENGTAVAPAAATESSTSPVSAMLSEVSPTPIGTPVPANGMYAVVAWDMDTTGRRLIDEICHIGAFYQPLVKEEPKDEEEKKPEQAVKSEEGEGKENEQESTTPQNKYLFSQYVMPYKNPNSGARRSFGIRVVNIGRYRMLKDMESGKVLKTKSEVSALQEFVVWLKMVQETSGCKDGVLLAFHETTRKVLVPLLLQALDKYRLREEFSSVVKGFVNGVHVVHKFGDKSKITSFSLRSLCKTVLNNTSPKTAIASDRSQVLVDLLTDLAKNETTGKLDASKIATVAVTVNSEEKDLENLKEKLSVQSTLRPIFEPHLRQRRQVRERAMNVRGLIADAHVNLDTLSNLYESAKITIKPEPEAEDQVQDEVVPEEKKTPTTTVDFEKLKTDLSSKLESSGIVKDDVDMLADLMEDYFNLEKRKAREAEFKAQMNANGMQRQGNFRGRGRGRGRGFYNNQGGRQPRTNNYNNNKNAGNNKNKENVAKPQQEETKPQQPTAVEIKKEPVDESEC